MITLREFLEVENTTQRAFAKRAGISVSYLNEVVAGKKTPSLKKALAIYAATDSKVSLESLVGSPSAGASQSEAS